MQASHQATRPARPAHFFSDWRVRAPYSLFHERFLATLSQLNQWPAPSEYDDLAKQVPHVGAELAGVELPHFVAQDHQALQRFGGYEWQVAGARAVPTRAQSWHDFFNMVVWAHFPRLRWALNSVHVDRALGPIDPRNGRAPTQNVAAQFDESGLIVASSNAELLVALRALRFKYVFWERRAELLATTCFWVVGHGLLESLLTPHPKLLAKGLLLELPREPGSYSSDDLRGLLDSRVADRIRSWRSAAPRLDPVPVLGIPGYADNSAAEYYDDAHYFRGERRSRGECVDERLAVVRDAEG